MTFNLIFFIFTLCAFTVKCGVFARMFETLDREFCGIIFGEQTLHCVCTQSCNLCMWAVSVCQCSGCELQRGVKCLAACRLSGWRNVISVTHMCQYSQYSVGLILFFKHVEYIVSTVLRNISQQCLYLVFNLIPLKQQQQQNYNVSIVTAT